MELSTVGGHGRPLILSASISDAKQALRSLWGVAYDDSNRETVQCAHMTPGVSSFHWALTSDGEGSHRHPKAVLTGYRNSCM